VNISAGVLALAILLGASGALAQPSPPPVVPPGGGLLGGGQPQLVIPPPAPLTPEQLRTVQRLDRAKREDSGRGLDWVWVDAEGGFEQLGLQTLNGGDQSFVAGLVKTSSSGGAVGVGLGARLLFLTLLVRARVGVFDSGQLYRVGPEAGFHIPMGRIEPRATFGLGYAGVSNLQDAVGGMAAPDLSLKGFYTRLAAGIDYFPMPVLSVGATLSSDLLVLVRPALSSAQVSQIQAISGLSASQRASASLLTSTGTGVGGTIALTAVAALHF
jgi:hypothetical protein